MASAQVENVGEQETMSENAPLVINEGNKTDENDAKDVSATKDMRPRVPGIKSTSFEEGFYRHFMNPMMSRLEDSMKKNNDILDDINKKMKEESEERRKKQMSRHIPELLQGNGQELKDVMRHIEDLILYENFEKSETDTHKLVKARLKELDENAEVAVLSHSVGAYVSTLEPSHLKHFSARLVSDTTLWLIKMFRFGDASAFFHEDERDGLVRVCRLALLQKYAKYATDGYEALYARPPVFYVSGAARHGLGHYICSQLGLPLSCFCSVPTLKGYGNVHKINIPALEKLIEDDKSSGRSPTMLVAFAGTPLVGHVDNIKELSKICKENEMMLHLEGNNLATMALYSVPTNVLPAQHGDSMTLNLGGWLGLPAVPFSTLYKCNDPVLARQAGLLAFNARHKLSCIPLWICLQNLGHEGTVQKITYSVNLAKAVREKVNEVPSLKNLTKKPDVPQEEVKAEKLSITGIISKALNALLIYEMENPTVVFKYKKEDPNSPSDAAQQAPEDQEANSEETEPQEVDPYMDALNIWLCETLKREVPRVHVTAVEVEGEGVCLRFAPMESGHLFDTRDEDVQLFCSIIERQLSILDATVRQRQDFQDIVVAQDNLLLMTLPNWAGLGAIQYVPEMWLEHLDNLPDHAKSDLNNLNQQLVMLLKSSDTAFSLGQTEDGVSCVRFGLITQHTDLEELIALVYTTGKEVEESSKFLETMGEMVRQSIEKANQDLLEENQNKLAQEGVLRQVPLVSSLMNWWSPPPKEAEVKGRALNLASGVVESTESTYKYHMQVQAAADQPSSPRVKDGPLKGHLKPHRRSSEKSRTTSETSVTSTDADGGSSVPVTPQPLQEVAEVGIEGEGDGVKKTLEKQFSQHETVEEATEPTENEEGQKAE